MHPQYRLFVYAINGKCLQSYEPHENLRQLGLRCVSLSRNQPLVALGCYDQHLQIVNLQTWRLVCDFFHSAVIDSDEMVGFRLFFFS